MEKYSGVLEIINKFVGKMGYLDNEHVLGVFFYGSYLTGYNNKNSDIDLHVIFDNSDLLHLIRGNMYIDNTRIEYFEKPIEDVYLTINNDFITQNNAMLSIIGTSMIIFDKTGELKQLQEYTVDKFSKPLPPLDEEEAREYVSIINNRMERLRKTAMYKDPYFYHLYHLTLEKIRKFYHRVKGFPKLSTSKVFRVYTDEEYRKSFYKENIPEDEFVSLYLTAITDISSDIDTKLEFVEKLYEYARRDISLDERDYRISIKSRNVQATCLQDSIMNNNKRVKRLVFTKKIDNDNSQNSV